MNTETQTEIALNARAQAQLRELLDGVERLNGQVTTYVTALGAALDAPDGWQLDPRRMAFVAPPAQPEPAAADPTAEDA